VHRSNDFFVCFFAADYIARQNGAIKMGDAKGLLMHAQVGDIIKGRNANLQPLNGPLQDR
jgi:hypothetical protein